MDRADYVKKFYETDVLDICYDTIVNADLELKKNKVEIVKKLTDKLNKFFQKLIDLQKRGEKGKIYCIAIQVLRTKILHKECKVLVTAYDENFYNDKNPVNAYFDMEDIFKYLFIIEEKLDKERPKYIRKINYDDVEMAVQRFVEMYKDYMVKFMKISLKDLEKWECFKELDKEDEFFIITCEYKDNIEFVYKALGKRTEIENKKIVEEINGKPKGIFAYELFNDLNLAELDLRNENFCFTNFRNSNLSFCDIRVAFCIGSDFRNCTMVGTSFEHSFIHDADFRESNLFGAIFRNVNGNLTTPTKEVLYTAGFSGVDFRGSILQRADFADGNFTGADFRYAKFEETNFKETNLQGAIFDKDSLKDLKLSPKQLEEIIIE